MIVDGVPLSHLCTNHSTGCRAMVVDPLIWNFGIQIFGVEGIIPYLCMSLETRDHYTGELQFSFERGSGEEGEHALTW